MSGDRARGNRDPDGRLLAGGDASGGEVVESLLTYLRLVASHQQGQRDPGWLWDSVEQLLLTTAGDPVIVDRLTLPSGVTAGPMKACYYNAYMTSLRHPCLDYTEGFAMSAGLIPVHHAWLTDRRTGAVVDPTWVSLDRSGPTAYLGLRFSAAFLQMLAEGSEETPTVFESDWKRKHLVLRRGLAVNADGVVDGWRRTDG